jgi:predicted ATPase
MNTSIRIAFTGASGTGKTTVAKQISTILGIPFNPIGSRSVAQSMGFGNPYDVDKAGKRAEFQRRLVTEKQAWEDSHEDFVSDRTTVDNLCYTALHDVSAVDKNLLDQVETGMRRYTHVVLFPVKGFCKLSGDAARVQDMVYQRLFESALTGFLGTYGAGYRVLPLDCVGVNVRVQAILEMVRK